MGKLLIYVLMLVIFTNLYAGDLFSSPDEEEYPITPLLKAPLLFTHTEYYIQNRELSHLTLDTEKNEPLGKIRLFAPNNSYAQRFFFIGSGKKYRLIKGQHYTHILAGSEDIFLSREENDPAGFWYIILSGEQDYYYIISDVNGRALTAYEVDGETQTGLAKLTGDDSQKWKMKPVRKN